MIDFLIRGINITFTFFLTLLDSGKAILWEEWAQQEVWRFHSGNNM